MKTQIRGLEDGMHKTRLLKGSQEGEGEGKGQSDGSSSLDASESSEWNSDPEEELFESDPEEELCESVVDTDTVFKGASVTLSKRWREIVTVAGASHPHYKFLDNEGIIKAIGEDGLACIAAFEMGQEKFCIGRNGEFHLAHSDFEAKRGNWPKGKAAEEGGEIMGGAARSLDQQELLVSGDNVRKGESVKLSRSRREEVLMEGFNASHYACLGRIGTVSKIGEDHTACIATFGKADFKFLIGRNARFELAHAAYQSPNLNQHVLGVTWVHVGRRIMVKTLDERSAAAKGGKIRVGDVLLLVQGKPAGSTVDEVCRQIEAVQSKIVNLKIRRTGMFGEDIEGIVSIPRTRITSGESFGNASSSSSVATSSAGITPRSEGATTSRSDDSKGFGDVDITNARKGLKVVLSKEHCETVQLAGASHEHYPYRHSHGEITGIGHDHHTCLAKFGDQEIMFHIGKNAQFQLSEDVESDPSPLSGNFEGLQIDQEVERSEPTYVQPVASAGVERDTNAANQHGQIRGVNHGSFDAIDHNDVLDLIPGRDSGRQVTGTASPGTDSEQALLLAGLHSKRIHQDMFYHKESASRDEWDMPSKQPANIVLPSSQTFVPSTPSPMAQQVDAPHSLSISQPHRYSDQPTPPNPIWGAPLDRIMSPVAQLSSGGFLPDVLSQSESGPHSTPSGLGILVEEKDGFVVIDKIASNSAAAAADPLIRIGDQINSIDGEAVHTASHVRRLAPGVKGSTVTVEAMRVTSRIEGGTLKRVTTLISFVRGMPGKHRVEMQVRDGAESGVSQSSKAYESPIPSPPHSLRVAGMQSILSILAKSSPEKRSSMGSVGSYSGSDSSPVTPTRSPHNSLALANVSANRSSAHYEYIGLSNADKAITDMPLANLPSSPPRHQTSAFHFVGHGAGAGTSSLNPDFSQERMWGVTGPETSTGSSPGVGPSNAPKSGDYEDGFSDKNLVFDVQFEELELLYPPIGVGTCKNVYMAMWNEDVVAALEIRKGNAAKEVSILKHLSRHPHIPVFHGVSKGQDGNIFLVQEFFQLAGLDVQLEIWDSRLSVSVRLCITSQICEAMAAIHGQGVLHRDLAARNVLVHSLHCDSVADVWVKTKQHTTRQVSDFGLAHQGVEVVVHEKTVPWRWAPPEVFRDCRWSQKSDVWAFAVCMWEVFTFAMIPYVEISDDEVLRRKVFDEGLRLERPVGCPQWIYAIMCRCWSDVERQRPHFYELQTEFQAMAHLCSPVSSQPNSESDLSKRVTLQFDEGVYIDQDIHV